MARLETPSVQWRDSFFEALTEFYQDGVLLKCHWAGLERDFPGFVRGIIGYSRGEGLPEGYVSGADYWLIDEDQFIGRVWIRRELTDGLRKIGGHIGYQSRPSQQRRGYGTQILALSLPKAREIGQPQVLVTCDEDNIGSKKIIEANGGKLENIQEAGTRDPRTLSYWIELGESESSSPDRKETTRAADYPT